MESVVITDGVVRRFKDNKIHWMMKVSLGHSTSVLGVSHNQYNSMSILEIYPANNRFYYEKNFLSFEHIFPVLCPAEEIALEIAFCSTVDLIIENTSKNLVYSLKKQ